jgi:ATP-binding cassette subfamily B protein
MLIAALAEMVSIGAIFPFLGVITSPETVFTHPLMQPINSFFEINSAVDLRVIITSLFVVVVILAGLIRILLIFISTRLLFATGIDISLMTYNSALHKPYIEHVKINSSELINSVFNKSGDVVYGIMMPTVTLVSSIIIIIGVVSILVVIDPIVMLASFSIFSLIYGVMIWLTSKKIKSNSKLISNDSTRAIKYLQEGIGGIRDVLMSNSQTFYYSIYQNTIKSMMRAKGSNSIIGASPRYIIETIGIVFIALLAYILTGNEELISTAIPTLGVLAVGAQKLLPTLQQCYLSISTIKSSEYPLRDVLSILESSNKCKEIKVKSLQFNNKIELKDVGFKYDADANFVLRNISLVINKGDCIGIVGETGSGKSTLIDILMGLISPVEGSILIDDQILDESSLVNWRKSVAHVPQSIYLADTTIEENIAFGKNKEDIDVSRISQAAALAQIEDVISTMPKKYKTIIGENGVSLSGGQRQRIGIARALYTQSDVIVLDEATSALDYKTENKVMDSISQMNTTKTILIIAHRTETLKNCNKIIKLENGKISEIGRYSDFY